MDDKYFTNTEIISGKQLEDSIGYKPVGTRNYIFTIFSRKTDFREILFGGAIPFHKASENISKFYEHYINNADNNSVYHLSVILDSKNLQKETETLILIKLEPSHILSKRRDNVRQILYRTYQIFDSIYKSYIRNDKEYTKKYRTYVGFKEFLDSRDRYNTSKIKIYNLITGNNIVNID